MPLKITRSPDYPFQMVAADYFEVKNHSYAVYADRYTGWSKAMFFPRNQATSSDLIGFLRDIFVDTGAPEELSCDGGSTFVSGETKEFLKRWGVKTRQSSMGFAQSNGRAEAAVKAAKKLIMDNVDSSGRLNTDKYAMAVMASRNTVMYPELGKTVAQSLLGRNLRDALPAMNGWYDVKREYIVTRDEREKLLAETSRKVVERWNATARELPPLSVGDKVRVQNQTTVRKNKWDKTGIITEVLPNRQYWVKIDGSGRCTLRNRRFLRKIGEIQDPTKVRRDVPAQPDHLPNRRQSRRHDQHRVARRRDERRQQQMQRQADARQTQQQQRQVQSAGSTSSEDDGWNLVQRRRRGNMYQPDVRTNQPARPVDRVGQEVQPDRRVQPARPVPPAPAPARPTPRRSSRAKAPRDLLQVGHRGQSHTYQRRVPSDCR